MYEIQDKKFKVEKIVFYNASSSWGVLATAPVDFLGEAEFDLLNDFGNISISGNFRGVFEGCEIQVTGDIVCNSRFGKQIQIRTVKVLEDVKNKEGVINFLARSMIQGISIQNAKKIYNTFKENAIDIVLNNPEKLIRINGIGRKTVNKVQQSVAKYRAIKPLIEFGTELDLPYGLIMKLHDELGVEALSVIKTDPYKVLELSDTITFKQVDDIYIKNGGNPTGRQRLEKAFLYLLKHCATLEGSTGYQSFLLEKRFYRLLELDASTDSYRAIKDKLEAENKIETAVKENAGEVIYYKEFLDIEKSIAEKIINLNRYGISTDKLDEKVIEEEINNFPFTLNEQQLNAVKSSLNKPVCVLTGPAGCVDGDTEYFNGEGWIPIRNYSEGDSVLQYNSDGTANLVHPSSYIKNAADLYQIKNTRGSIDMVLSKNHRFIYLSSKGHINEKPFGEIMNIMKEKGSFSAKIISSFRCTDEFCSISPERLRLLIAISADGSLYKSGNFWRVRIIKERKIERLRKLIQDVGLTIEERVFADGYHNFKIPVEYGCKEFPDSFYFLNDKLKEVFKEEVVLWDGSVTSGRRCVCKYFTSIKKNADLVQFIFSQFGTRASITTINRVGKERAGGYKYKSIKYSVSLTKERYGSLQHRKERPAYSTTPYNSEDKFQYCFQVPSGMLVLRRNNNIFITGNCGKSSITKALYNIYRRCGLRVFLTSPTAKAAIRLSECTGGCATTIHRFLGIGIPDDDRIQEITSEKLGDSVVIIDEASMLDIMLFNKILERAGLMTKIILVGDNNQLPSVQAGNVLGDLVFSCKTPVSILTDVMRQGKDSNIIKYCNLINKGEIFEPCSEPDFHYEEFGEGSELREFLVKNYLKDVKKYGLQEVQVITPYKQGELGMNNLNTLLQKTYNVEGEPVTDLYKIGDRVRHTVNNYKKKVFNGETGIITAFDEEDNEIQVDYGDRCVWYDNVELYELMLAYASTVHASQGSEYKVCYVILDDTAVNDFLFIRRLLYTAVSRGKEKVYILSKPYLLDKCITNANYKPRLTKLTEFLDLLNPTPYR